MSMEEVEVHSCECGGVGACSLEGSVLHQVWVCPLGVSVSTRCGCVH